MGFSLPFAPFTSAIGNSFSAFKGGSSAVPIPSLTYSGGTAGPVSNGPITNGSGNTVNFADTSTWSFWIFLAAAGAGILWFMKKRK